MKYKHVFGPVPSRRLGISLGVDLVLNKSCNLNCVFCECGATAEIKEIRQSFKDIEEIKEELSCVLKEITPDYITFSGSGEPTLSKDFMSESSVCFVDFISIRIGEFFGRLIIKSISTPSLVLK